MRKPTRFKTMLYYVPLFPAVLELIYMDGLKDMPDRAFTCQYIYSAIILAGVAAAGYFIYRSLQ